MTGREYESKKIIADVVFVCGVDCSIEIFHSRLLPRLDVATELLVLALDSLFSAKKINRTMLTGGHEPGTRVAGDTRLRPLLERGDESILCELLGKTDIAHNPRETRDEPGRLDPPDCFDSAMCIGSRHGFPPHHF